MVFYFDAFTLPREQLGDVQPKRLELVDQGAQDADQQLTAVGLVLILVVENIVYEVE